MKAYSIISIGIVAILFSCDNSSKEEKGAYFFDFDEVVHYSIEVDENDLLSEEGNPNLNEDDQLLMDLVILNTPNSVNDTAFIPRLESIGFIKNQLDESKLSKINEIFREQEVDEWEGTKCVAVYRDILIFRKENKTIGMAKICFECGKKLIYGTEASTVNFGQKGDYGKLHSLLSN